MQNVPLDSDVFQGKAEDSRASDVAAVQKIRAILEPFNPMERQAILEFVRATTASNPYANVGQIGGVAAQLGGFRGQR